VLAINENASINYDGSSGFDRDADRKVYYVKG